MDPKFEVFAGDDQQHYWRLLASNGQVIATGGEGYSSRAAAIRATGNVTKAIVGIAAAAATDSVEAAAQAAEGETP